MTLFLVLLAARLADRLVDEPFDRRRAAALVAALLAAVFTHYYAAVFLLPVLLLARAAKPPARRWLAGAAVGTGVVLVAALAAKSTFGRIGDPLYFLRPFTPFELWMLDFHWFLHGNALWTVSPYRAAPGFLAEHPGLLLAQLAAAALFGLGLAAALRSTRRTERPAELAWIFVLPAAMLAVTAAGQERLYIERYALPALPFFVGTLAAGAAAIGRRPLRATAAFVLVGWTAVAWWSWLERRGEWTVYKPNPDFRSAAREIVDNAPEVRGRSAVLRPAVALDFYLQRFRRQGAPGIRRLGPRGEGRLDLRGLGRVYLARDRTWDLEEPGLVQRLEADPRLRALPSRELLGVELHAYRVVRPIR
jgi:hypothetical protein